MEHDPSTVFVVTPAFWLKLAFFFAYTVVALTVARHWVADLLALLFMAAGSGAAVEPSEDPEEPRPTRSPQSLTPSRIRISLITRNGGGRSQAVHDDEVRAWFQDASRRFERARASAHTGPEPWPESGPETGIQVVEEELRVDGTCGVCGEEVRERVVHCQSCMTPHHRECFLYNGSCAVYGCRGRRYRERHMTVPRSRVQNPLRGRVSLHRTA